MRFKVTSQKRDTYRRPSVYVIDARRPVIGILSALSAKAQKELTMKALKRVGLDLIPQDLKFSNRLGCSCGCSPGMLIVSAVDDRHMDRDYYITITK